MVAVRTPVVPGCAVGRRGRATMCGRRHVALRDVMYENELVRAFVYVDPTVITEMGELHDHERITRAVLNLPQWNSAI